MALAAQALSVQAVTGNRLTLGIGTSHPHMVEGMFGLSMEQPAKYAREYVEALGPLLSGEPTNYEGERLTARGQIEITGAEAAGEGGSGGLGVAAVARARIGASISRSPTAGETARPA